MEVKMSNWLEFVTSIYCNPGIVTVFECVLGHCHHTSVRCTEIFKIHSLHCRVTYIPNMHLHFIPFLGFTNKWQQSATQRLFVCTKLLVKITLSKSNDTFIMKSWLSLLNNCMLHTCLHGFLAGLGQVGTCSQLLDSDVQMNVHK